MPVTTIGEFRAKYGERGRTFRLLVEALIERAPEFPGDAELATAIGEAMADLESALSCPDPVWVDSTTSWRT